MRPRSAFRHFQQFLQKRYGPTDQRTDQRMDGRMDKASYRVACLQLKMPRGLLIILPPPLLIVTF